MAISDDAMPPDGRRWGVEDVPLSGRFAAWCEIVSKTHLAFALDPSPESSGSFAATVHEHQFGDMGLLETEVLPHRGRRTRQHVAANTRDVVGIHFIRSGRVCVEIDNANTVLGPGDAMFWDGAATGHYEIPEPLHKTTLIIPRIVAATLLPGYRQKYVRVLRRDQPPTHALTQVLTTLSDQFPALSPGARHASAALVAQMLKSLDPLEHDSTSVPTQRSTSQLRERILQYVDDNLPDPTLSPASIAAVHSVSLRTLYTALDGLGTTLAAYIRTRRLAQCYEDLLLGTDPVGEIALRWGFSHHAHFSRAFQQRYGMRPSEVRRATGRP
jgi:AraC-like DNA-binding protein